jgi:transcriptional regulator with XRE-family HTH domain
MKEPPAQRRGSGRPPLHVVSDLDGTQPQVHLGERLRAVRTRAGLTQEKAAVASGITRNHLAQLEKSRFPNPGLQTLLRLMRTYGLRSIEELFGPVPSSKLATAWEAEEWATSRAESSQ